MRHTYALALLTLVLITSPDADAALAPVYDDIWDFSKGTQVTGNSPTSFTPIGAIIGQRHNLGGEQDNTYFADGAPAGFVHFIEYQTAAPVTLRAINLFAGDDRSSGNAGRRAFSEFRLYGWNGTAYELVYGQTETIPYPVQVPVTGAHLVHDNIPEFTSDRWRAEFVQPGAYQGTQYGPRVIELDGFDTYFGDVPIPPAVPLPAAGLMGLLGGGLVFGRRRRWRA